MYQYQSLETGGEGEVSFANFNEKSVRLGRLNRVLHMHLTMVLLEWNLEELPAVSYKKK